MASSVVPRQRLFALEQRPRPRQPQLVLGALQVQPGAEHFGRTDQDVVVAFDELLRVDRNSVASFTEYVYSVVALLHPNAPDDAFASRHICTDFVVQLPEFGILVLTLHICMAQPTRHPSESASQHRSILSCDLFVLELRYVVLFELSVRLHERFGTHAYTPHESALGQLHNVFELHGAAVLKNSLLELRNVFRHELAVAVLARDERIARDALDQRVVGRQCVQVLGLEVLVRLQPTVGLQELELRPEICWRIGCRSARQRQPPHRHRSELEHSFGCNGAWVLDAVTLVKDQRAVFGLQVVSDLVEVRRIAQLFVVVHFDVQPDSVSFLDPLRLD